MTIPLNFSSAFRVIYQSIHQSIYSSTVCIYPSIGLSIYQSIHLSICPSIHLSINPSTYRCTSRLLDCHVRACTVYFCTFTIASFASCFHTHTNITCGFLFVNLILSGVFVLKPVMLHSNFNQLQLLHQGAALLRVTFIGLHRGPFPPYHP